MILMWTLEGSQSCIGSTWSGAHVAGFGPLEAVDEGALADVGHSHNANSRRYQ